MIKEFIGFKEALGITLDHIQPLAMETVSLSECQDRIVCQDLYAMVNSPSVDASLKDGYAVRSKDIRNASREKPVRLKLIGTAAAGIPFTGALNELNAVKILTGGKIPEGADAVVAGEFTDLSDSGDTVIVRNHAEPGRNIFKKGKDVSSGERLILKGSAITPGLAGLLAASGHSDIPVYKRPRVAMIATGDEVVMPGRPLAEGKLYASNLITLNAWCRRYAMNTTLEQVSDLPDLIQKKITWAMDHHDALITSGGAWTGDRDLVVAMLSELGWTQYYHRIRIGPGKAVGFGLLNGKPVFVLPGGPPSNLLAFLMIALPGLVKLSGGTGPVLPQIRARLSKTLTVRDKDWTQFVFGSLLPGDDCPVFMPIEMESRLQSMAKAQAVMAVPEGVSGIEAQTILTVQSLR